MTKELENIKYTEAKDCFYKKSYQDAKKLFSELEMPYEEGLCMLLSEQPKEARRIWQNAEEQSSAIKWGLLVCDYIHLKHKESPTYFQIRSFLEVYLNLFIENKLFSYAENLISAQNILAQYNPETYKFIARVLFAHGYLDILPDFINMSKKCCYRDPEIHFIEAQMYYEKKEFEKSLKALEEIHLISPDYFPANNLKKIVACESAE